MTVLPLNSHALPRPSVDLPLFPRRILACISLSPRAPAVAAEAWRIAQATSSQCTFLHADTTASMVTQAQLRQILSQAGVPANAPVLIRRGKPRQIVREIAAAEGIDLVIAGVLNRQATFSRHFQSLAGQIAATAPCSVLLFTSPKPNPQPLKRIVNWIDLDDTSHDMLSDVLPWARAVGAQNCHLVHVYDPAGLYSDEAGDGYDSRDQKMQKLTQFTQSIDWAGLSAHKACLINKHGCDAIWYAQTIRADVLCIPITERRQSFWQRLIKFRLDVDIDALPCTVLLYRKP